MSGTAASQIKQIVAYIRKGKPKAKDVIFGPIVQRDTEDWYFVFVHDNAGEAYISSLGADDRELAALFRTQLIEALSTAQFVPHDFDDELAVAQLAEGLWPSERTRRLHERVKAERADTLAQEREAWGVDALLKERPLSDAEIVLFGLDADTAKQFFAIDSDSGSTGSVPTAYFRMVEVDIGEDKPVSVAQPYFPP